VASEPDNAEPLWAALAGSSPVALAVLDDHYRYLHANAATAAMTGTPLHEHPGRTPAEITPKLWAQLQPLYHATVHHHTTTTNAEITGETPAHPHQRRTWLLTCYPLTRPDTTTAIAIATITTDITARKTAETALDALTHAVVDTIAATVEAKDPYTTGHERRVAEISAAIATQLGLDEWTTEGIKLAANIRDIGKINVPTEILFRPGQLRPLEYQLIQGHSQAGHDIIANINFPWPIADMVLQHHERYNGTGYPGGLTATDITLGARIIAVADVIDSMASQRPYRAAQPLQTALTEIQQGRGTLYDPHIVDACLQLFQNGTLTPGPDGAITTTTPT
jgi:HD-GYP domain-containing protein (c-di-GMP phosphodiesterase class II)